VTGTASNFALEPTASSFGCADASGGGSPRALDFKRLYLSLNTHVRVPHNGRA
jgi:hypothetical protein